MKSYVFTISLIILGAFASVAQKVADNTPRLVKNGAVTQLLVDNKPYLILGGELGNSSASNMAYMKPIWPRLKKMDVNTIYTPVYWELMEPQEGKFDFKLVDDMITGARANQIKLVLLWFGSWKNSMTCYAPEWVKTNPARFPRAEDKNNKKQEILSPFSRNNVLADKAAFVKLMQHLKAFDGQQHTVLMIQVENEIGMLPNARNYDAGANAAFEQEVPAKLMNYLRDHTNNLFPETKELWGKKGFKTSGNWEAVFGKSLATDEAFMAWHFALYTNEVAAAGKQAYNLPMYVNAALNRPGKAPGEYPSAGPLPQVMDIWKAGAPAIDVFGPDFYNPDFKHWSDLYTRAGNPLLIPEIRFEAGVDAKALFAFGNYNCLSFSPFSIESTEHPDKEPIGKAYRLLKQLTSLITKYQPMGKVSGFWFNKDSASQQIMLGKYVVTVGHEYNLNWSPQAKDSLWPETGGIIIMLGPDEFYIAGTGIVATFKPIDTTKSAGYISVDEGDFINQKWTPARRMNGDQDHQGRHVRVAVNDYSIQHVRVYTY